MDNETGERRSVESEVLANAVIGTIRGMSAIVGGEAARAIDDVFTRLPPHFRVKPVEEQHGA